MAQHGYISRATARAAAKSPLGLHLSTVPLQTGCTSPGVKDAAFFCDYVMSVLKNNPAYKKAYAQMQSVGRAEDLHDAQRTRPARRHECGELRGPGQEAGLQPWV